MSFTSGRRDLRLVATAKAVSFFGDELATVALLLRLQGSGAGPGAVAALLVANLVPLALLSGIAGQLVDRYDNRLLLVVSSVTQGVLCAVLAAVTDFATVLSLVALLGAGQAVNGSAWQALVPSLVPPARLTHALGRVQAAVTLAGVAAPALAGLLVGAYGTRVPLLVDAATFAAVASAALLLQTRRVPAASAGRRAGGLGIVWGHPVLRPAVSLLGLFVLLGGMVNVVEVFLVRSTLHASVTWYGLVGAAQAAGLLIGATLAGRGLAEPITRARALAGSAFGLALGLVLIGAAPDVYWMLAACLLTGAANGVLNVATSALVMGSVGPHERGRVGAVLTGVVSATQLAALATGGALASVLEPRVIFLLGGGLGLLAPALVARRLLAAVRSDCAPRRAEPQPA